MASFEDILDTDIRQELPRLTDEVRGQVIEVLVDLAESTEELPLLEETDLPQPPLRKLQARKLVAFFKKKYKQQADEQPVVQAAVAPVDQPGAQAAVHSAIQHAAAQPVIAPQPNQPAAGWPAPQQDVQSDDNLSMPSIPQRSEAEADQAPYSLESARASSLSSTNSVQGTAASHHPTDSTPPGTEAEADQAPYSLESARASSLSSTNSVQGTAASHHPTDSTPPANQGERLAARSMTEPEEEPPRVLPPTRQYHTAGGVSADRALGYDVTSPTSPRSPTPTRKEPNTDSMRSYQLPSTDAAFTTPRHIQQGYVRGRISQIENIPIPKKKGTPGREQERESLSQIRHRNDSTRSTDSDSEGSEEFVDAADSLDPIQQPEAISDTHDVSDVSDNWTAAESPKKMSTRSGSSKYRTAQCSAQCEGIEGVKREEGPVSFVFYLLVPKGCKDVQLCLHQPESATPATHHMIRIRSDKNHLFTCTVEVHWDQVGYHYRFENGKTESPLKVFSLHEDPDQTWSNTKKRYHFDQVILSDKSDHKGSGWLRSIKNLLGWENQGSEKDRSKLVDGMLSCVDWSNVNHWYPQLCEVQRCMKEWNLDQQLLKLPLSYSVNKQVLIVRDGYLSKDILVHLALILITLDRKGITNRLDPTQIPIIFNALQMKTADDAHIADNLKQRHRSLFHSLLDFIVDMAAHHPHSLTWLYGLPLLRLLDYEHEGDNEMPPWWGKELAAKVKTAFALKTGGEVLRHINPILLGDQLTIVTLLSQLSVDQLIATHKQIPPNILLGVTLLLTPQSAHSGKVKGLKEMFTSALTRLRTSTTPVLLTGKLRSASEKCNEMMKKLGENQLETKILLANCANKMVHMADKDEEVTANFMTMVNSGIVPHLTYWSSDQRLDEIIKTMSLVLGEDFAHGTNLEDVIKRHLDNLLSKVSPQERIKLFGIWKSRQPVHHLVLSGLRNCARATINDCLAKGKEELVFSPECCNDKTADLYTDMFVESWEGQDPRRHLLTWPYMQHFIQAFERDAAQSKMAAGMNKLKEVIQRALNDIADGTITDEDMLLILDKQESFIERINMAHAWTADIGNKSRLDFILRLRGEQLDKFGTFKTGLTSFEDRCHQAVYDVGGLHDLSMDQWESCQMKDLFESPPFSKVHVETDWFSNIKTIDLPDKITQTFAGLLQVDGHRVFDNFFENLCHSNLDIESLNLEEFAVQIVGQSLNQWAQILADMKDGSINLHLVKILFEPMLDTDIQKELWYMCGDRRIYDERLMQVRRYFRLLQYNLINESIMNLRRTYSKQLTGNFEILQRVVEMDESAVLSSITGEAEAIMTELDTLDKDKLEWLDTFHDAHPLVKWLQDELRSPKEVEKLLDMQIFTSSGHSDLEMSKATSLMKVVNAFEPLIYGLPENAGLSDLLEKFRQIWKHSGIEKKLCQELIALKKHLEWLKDLKMKQSGVGRDALSRVEDINSKGIYIVGNLKGNTRVLDQMITASVPEANGKEETYSFSDLQNLQSTLVLVAGQNEKSKKHVQYFSEVLNAVRGVAETFSKLCDNGNILFEGWSSKFYCNEETDVNTFINFGLASGILAGPRREGRMLDHVKQIQDFMKGCLTDWDQHIQEQRERFPVLNSFTTKQIVLLRNELSKITGTRGPMGIPDKIFPLLKTVLPHCTRVELKDAWVNTVKEMKSAQQDEGSHEKGQPKTEEEKVIQSLQSRGLHREQIIRAIKENNTLEEQELMLWCWKREDSAKAKGIVDSTAIQREETHHSIMQNIIEQVAETEQRRALKDRLNSLWKKYLSENTAKSLKDYLSVVHLGHMLTFLKDKCKDIITRDFPKYFHKGRPNLVLCEEVNVWKKVLSTYMHEGDLPLPTRDEVLLCTKQTTPEDVQLLLMRAAKDNTKIFMLVNIDQLPYKVAQQVETDMQKILQGCSEYCLVVMCCRERQDGNPLVTALYANRIEETITYSTQEIRNYVSKHLNTNKDSTGGKDRSSVNIIQSRRAGVGKTLWVRNQKTAHPEMRFVGVPLHGKMLDIPGLVNRMCKYTLAPDSRKRSFFHIDIPHEMNMGVEQLLFELIILRSLSDPKGYLWARSEKDYYVLEVMPLQRWEVQAEVTGAEGSQPVHHMLELLPSITCQAPHDCLAIMKENAAKASQEPYLGGTDGTDGSETDILMDEGRFKSEPFQRVYQFLLLLKENKDLDSINPQEVKGDMMHCLETLLEYSEIHNPSWAELNYFVQFLNIQWRQYKESTFCQLRAIAEQALKDAKEESEKTGKEIKVKVEEDIDNLPGLSEFVVHAMLQMSKDFVGRSLQIADEIARQDDNDTNDDEENPDRETIEQYELKRKWKASANPYVFFNPDGHTISFLGYHVDPDTMNLLDPQTKECLVEKIMDDALYSGLKVNNVDMKEDLNSLPRDKQLQKLCMVMGVDSHDPDPNYVLTSDNIKKMLAIYMRFRCQIPVIVMGESGCGKTYLVNFLCRLQKPQDPDAADIKNRFVLKIHGNLTEQDLIKEVKLAETHAKKNHKRYPDLFTVVFLDEVNTTEALSLVKEILCDHTINGEHLDMDSGLRFVAACNPYKKHSEEMIRKMEEGGLGYHVSSEKASDRFGCIPMRNLVYRVEPLPQSLLPLVWDFGQLDDETEKLYIKKIVHKHLRAISDFTVDDMEAIAGIIHGSQRYMRARMDECSHVSLRDPERVMVVMKWFLKNRNQLCRYSKECPDSKMWSLIMSLGVCYHAALETHRGDYRNEIVKYFRGNIQLQRNDGGTVANIIQQCQDRFVNDMKLEPTIAKNEALKENIFMMAVCMELRIPLFIIGKPGSSKTLSRQILANEMNGQASTSDLFKQLKKVHMTVYQCSPLSTAEGIIDMFQTCAAMQENNDLDEYVSVVVLDEVGLAEDTPEMPLKTLHHLLEHEREGEELAEPHKKVGFLGLSNWSLDPAKNNRALMVRRNSPDKMVLQKTAEALCQSDREKKQLSWLLPVVANGYHDLYKDVMKGEERKEFFGLRDFYSLVKMLYAFAKKNDETPNLEQIRHAILRNFGGLPDFDPMAFFKSVRLNKNATHDCRVDNSITGLINANLTRQYLNLENRHLLLLTENQAALSIIQEHFEVLRNAVIIFGSSFPDDLEFTKLCRAINRIKLCMERGETVILLNQDPIFESLYDALNQYYTDFGGENYVDIGLGHQRMKCRVHKDFKLVVVADSDTVHKNFPIPLINRFEKHYLATSTVLNKAQQDVIKDLKQWIKDFTKKHFTQTIKRGQPKDIPQEEIFIGYHKEAPAAIVLEVCKELGQYEGDETWKKQVLEMAKRKLLLCATPESIVLVEETGLKEEADVIQNICLKEQQKESLADHMKLTISQCPADKDTFTQVTTHSQLLPTSRTGVEIFGRNLGVQTEIVPIQRFSTEHEFSELLRSFYYGESNGKDDLLILQCDSGNEHQELLACCRYMILDEHRRLADWQPPDRARKHVVLVIQLPRLAGGCFTGFQMKPWECVHIDELYAHHQMPPIHTLLKGPVSAVLRPPGVEPEHTEEDDMSQQHEGTPEHKDELDFQKLFEFCIIPAMSILKDESVDGNQNDDKADNKAEQHANISRVDNLNGLLQQLPDEERTQFLDLMRWRIYLLQRDREKKHEGEEHARKWLSKVATRSREMKMLTFRTQVRKYIQKKMTGLIAGIIAFADCNNNLNILLKDNEPWKKHMWLKMLNNEKAINLSIEEDLGQSEPQEIPVKSHGAYGSKMESHLPFSWMIFKQIEGCMRAQRKGTLDAALLVPNILMGNDLWIIVLEALKEDAENDEMLVKRIIDNYLPDFVAMVYRSQSKTDTQFERQLVQEEIYHQYTSVLAEYEDITPHYHIPLIHAAYVQIQARIELFSQIVQRCPEIVKNMSNEKAVQNLHLNLELRAVQQAIVLMQPTYEQLREAEHSMHWYERTGQMAPLINQAFSNVQRGNEEQDDVSQEIKRLMNEWERIITVRMFASVVCPPTSDQKNMLLFCPLLWMVLEKANMKTEETIKNVDNFFQRIAKVQEKEMIRLCPACNKPMVDVYMLPCGDEACIPCADTQVEAHDLRCIECKEEHLETTTLTPQFSSGQQKLRNFKNSLQSFRMELVSRLCLPGATPPEDALIELLLNDITGLAENESADQKMKTVLLQLLMASHRDKVRAHLDTVFQNGEDMTKHKLELAVLYAQYNEDYHHNAMSKTRNDPDMMRDIAEKLHRSSKELKEPGLNVRRLEAIALTRYCLTEAADKLEMVYIQNLQTSTDVLVEELLPVLQELCTADITWPRRFLLKILVRRFSLDVALTLSKVEQLVWLMNKNLTSEETIMEPDPFVLYGDEYKTVRQCLSTDLSTGVCDNIKGWLDKVEKTKCGSAEQLLMLALVREARTRAQLTTGPALTEFVTKTEALTQKDLLQKLLNDSVAANCDKLQLSTQLPDAKDRVLRDLLLHLYISMRDTPTVSLLEPFKRLIHKPAEMKDAFLPTMPHDHEYEVLLAIQVVKHTTNMYVCPKGHKYTITECGLPSQSYSCPECGSQIGSSGKAYDLAKGNSKVSVEDKTKKGHILGGASDQPSDVVPERKLSLLQSNIIRLLLHLSMYLGANQDRQGVCSMTEPPVPEDEVADFLWQHLHHDLNALTQTMSIDDVVLLIHTIIIKMAEFTDKQSSLDDLLLKTKASREVWEEHFTTDILSSILDEKEDILQKAHKQIAADDTLGISKVLQMVYEAEDEDGENDDPVNMAVMWRYRLQVTFQTAAQRLAELRCGDNAEQVEGAKHELLHYFMKNEPLLRKVQLLPRIVKFHKHILQRYDHKITQKKASETSIKKFLVKEDIEFEELFKDYQSVWNIRASGKNIQGEADTIVEPLTKSTNLDKFLPKSEALDELINIQNALIEKLENPKLSTCNLGPDVNLLDVNPTHLVMYDPDKDLLPLVTANCSSSLLVGQGTKVKYDFDKMEYQLTEQFFEGKSKIVNTKLSMVFSDSLTAVHKLKNLEDKIPQETFSPVVEAELRNDTRYASDVYDLVTNLDMAISFLHTVGGDPERHLEDFMKKDLGMNEAPLPSTTKKFCKLKHINALWLLMSNEREKHAAKLGAVPFSTLNEEWYERFREPLEEDQQEQLERNLPKVNVDRLLMELFTCITLTLTKHDIKVTTNVNARLSDYLAETQDGVGALELPDGVDSIRVSQCMFTWRAVFEYIEDMDIGPCRVEYQRLATHAPTATGIKPPIKASKPRSKTKSKDNTIRRFGKAEQLKEILNMCLIRLGVACGIDIDDQRLKIFCPLDRKKEVEQTLIYKLKYLPQDQRELQDFYKVIIMRTAESPIRRQSGPVGCGSHIFYMNDNNVKTYVRFGALFVNILNNKKPYILTTSHLDDSMGKEFFFSSHTGDPIPLGKGVAWVKKENPFIEACLVEVEDSVLADYAASLSCIITGSPTVFRGPYQRGLPELLAEPQEVVIFTKEMIRGKMKYYAYDFDDPDDGCRKYGGIVTFPNPGEVLPGEGDSGAVIGMANSQPFSVEDWCLRPHNNNVTRHALLDNGTASTLIVPSSTEGIANNDDIIAPVSDPATLLGAIATPPTTMNSSPDADASAAEVTTGTEDAEGAVGGVEEGGACGGDIHTPIPVNAESLTTPNHQQVMTHEAISCHCFGKSNVCDDEGNMREASISFRLSLAINELQEQIGAHLALVPLLREVRFE